MVDISPDSTRFVAGAKDKVAARKYLGHLEPATPSSNRLRSEAPGKLATGRGVQQPGEILYRWECISIASQDRESLQIYYHASADQCLGTIPC